MSILGILLIYILPFGTGVILNKIFRYKEASQIETYLIGFFSVFLAQGLIFAPTTLFGVDFAITSRIFTGFTYGVMGIFVLIAIVCRNKVFAPLIHPYKPSKYELTSFILMILAFGLVILRIILLKGYLREDVMLSSVELNLSTGTVNAYNPVTNRPYELGLITSKKIITLPVYYTYLAGQWGIDARTLLYIVLPIQTVICLYFVYELMMRALLHGNHKKIYTSKFILGVMLLSGDYFTGSAGYRILWNGYSGDIIVGIIMIAFVVNEVMAIYRLERGDEGEERNLPRVRYILHILMCLAASIFMTSVATGLLMLVLSLASIAVCCTWRFTKEEKADG